MPEVKANSVIITSLAMKVDQALQVIKDAQGSLMDDTYLDKLVTELGHHMISLEPDSQRWQFWCDSGLKQFTTDGWRQQQQQQQHSQCGKLAEFCFKVWAKCCQCHAKITSAALDFIMDTEACSFWWSAAFYQLVSVIMNQSDHETLNQARLFDPATWTRLVSPHVTQISRQSHFWRQSFVEFLVAFIHGFLIRFLSQDDQQEEILSCLQKIFSDLSQGLSAIEDSVLPVIAERLLEKNLPAKKLKVIGDISLESAKGPSFSMEMRLFSSLLSQDNLSAVDCIEKGLMKNQSSTAVGLNGLKVAMKQLELKGYADVVLTRCDDLLSSFKEETESLTYLINRLLEFKCERLMAKCHGRVLELLDTFRCSDDPHFVPRDPNLPQELKLLRACLDVLYSVCSSDLIKEDDPTKLDATWRSLCQISLESGIPASCVSKILDIMNLLVMQGVSVSSRLSDIWPHSRSCHWEVVDSFLSILINMTKQNMKPETSVSVIESFASPLQHHQFAYIRAQAMALLIYIYQARKDDSAVLKLLGTGLADPDVEVRRAVVSCIQNGTTHSSKLREVMMLALTDQDWEVKEMSFAFWKKHLISPDVSEAKWPTLILEWHATGLIQAVSIALNDYESHIRQRAVETVLQMSSIIRSYSTHLSHLDSGVPGQDICEVLATADISDAATRTACDEFLKLTLLPGSVDERLQVVNDFVDLQIGLSSLLDDIIQSSLCCSQLEAVDCF